MAVRWSRSACWVCSATPALGTAAPSWWSASPAPASRRFSTWFAPPPRGWWCSKRRASSRRRGCRSRRSISSCGPRSGFLSGCRRRRRTPFAPEGGGAPDLYRVPLAVLTLLAEAAEEQPLLCVIDDAQWVDGDSAQALTFAARRLQAERIVIVFAAREGGFDAAALPELSLEPLDTTAVEAILAARAGAAVAPDIARRIASATGGNALAVVELAPMLTREQLAGGEPLPQPLPMSSGVERLFADRVRDLPADARLLLLIAAAEDTGRPDAVAAAARRLGSDLA